MRKGSRQLYRKMSFLYTAVLVCVVGLLAMYSISESKQQVQMTNQEYMRMAGKEARDYLVEVSDIADNIHATLYNSYTELDDLCHYLRDDTDEYMKYRLDNYGESASVSYVGIEDYVAKVFGSYSQLEQIRLYSPQLKMMTIYEKDGTCRRKMMTQQQANAAWRGMQTVKN